MSTNRTLRSRAGSAFGPGVLEPLERREVLTAVAWTGLGGSNLWSNPANWSGGAIPSSTSDVVINNPTASLSVVLDAGPVTVRSLTLNERLIINRGVTLSSPGEINLGADAELKINGLLNWAAGTWNAGSEPTVNPGGKLNIGRTSAPTQGVVTLASDLLNRGYLAWRGGTLELTSTGSLTNAATKAMDMSSPMSISGSGRFENFGLLRRGGLATSTTTIDADFNNDDRVRILRGTLAFGGADANQPSMINFGTLSGVATGSTFLMRAPTFHRDADYLNSAAFVFSTSTHIFRGDIYLGNAVFGSTSDVSISQGGARFRGDPTFNDTTLFLEGALTIGGNVAFNSTDVEGSSMIVTGTLALTGSNVGTDVSVLASGRINTTGSRITGGVSNAGTISVTSGVLTLDVQGASGPFVNSGSLLLGSTARLDALGGMVTTGLVQTSISSASFGRVTVSGNLALGGTLRSIFTGSGFVAGQNRTILSAGGRTGTFANVTATGLPVGMSTTVLYGATGAVVRLVG